MIDSIVMYPLDVMPLELGLNVLGLSSPELLFKFVEGLQGFGDDVVLGDGSKTAVLTKSILYVGDCADIVDYNALFQKAAIKKIIDEFDVDKLTRVLELQAELKTLIQDEIWDDDLPLEISSSLDLKTVISMAKLRVDVSSVGSLFDKIQMVVDTAGALAENRMLVTLHTTQYCNNDQLIDNKHLNENGIRYFCALSKEFVLITTNTRHPAFNVEDENLHIIYQNELSLKDALIKLKSEYGCERITIQTGGTLNNLFLREKLFDYVDIIIAPVLIGGKDTSTLIDGKSLTEECELSKLGVVKLQECVVLENSYLRLRYEVIH